VPGFLWLVRDSDDLVNWCRCEQGVVGSLPQMDCPWCGCGWLFSCVKCRKCFAFARAAIVPGSLEDIAQADFRVFYRREPTDAELAERTESMTWMIDDLTEGQRVVVLDGAIIPADMEGPLEFEGWHSRHSLPWVPQVRALSDPSVEQDVLSNPEYWYERKVHED
jgi:hypothetical protein